MLLILLFLCYFSKVNKFKICFLEWCTFITKNEKKTHADDTLKITCTEITGVLFTSGN